MEIVRYARHILDREGTSIHLRFRLDGKPAGLTCKVLKANEYPSDSCAEFSHPSPCFTRLFCFKRGVAQFRSAWESRDLVPGVIYLIPSDLPFDIRYERTHLYYFHLHITDSTRLSAFGRTKAVLELPDDYLFGQALATYEAGSEPELLSVLSLVVTRLMSGVHDELLLLDTLPRSQRDLLDRINQLPPAAVNINDLARELGVSRSTLSRNFRSRFGYSLKTYINEMTMQKARERLRYTTDTVETIAWDLGFSQPTYFYRFFRTHAGMTPRAYRESALPT